MGSVPRLLNPSTNPVGYVGAIGAVYAGVQMIYDAVNHRGAFSAPVFIALLAAVGSLWTWGKVTPVADPVDGAGRRLVPAVPPSPAVPPGLPPQ